MFLHLLRRIHQAKRANLHEKLAEEHAERFSVIGTVAVARITSRFHPGRGSKWSGRKGLILIGWRYSCPLNDRAKAAIGVQKVVGGVPLDPKSAYGMLLITLLEQSERPLFVIKLCIITRQLDRRDVATLRLQEAPAKLPANEAAGTAPIPGAPQVHG
jgi:hypothetical protein